MVEKYDWRTGRSCVFKNFIHLVFITKYRHDVLTEPMLTRLKQIFEETCLQMDAELLEFGGEADHCHLLVCCPPKLAVANLVSKLKGKSSYFLREEFWSQIKNKLWGNHFWTPSYCVVSAGGAPLEIIKKYIENQRTPTRDKYIKTSKKLSKKMKF
ncbi:MAG: IS200/IS605 family transposase [Oligoflexia bacterium]|nr:IS200/IS605 family transposase [Oligoflexia bacterium]